MCAFVSSLTFFFYFSSSCKENSQSIGWSLSRQTLKDNKFTLLQYLMPNIILKRGKVNKEVLD